MFTVSVHRESWVGKDGVETRVSEDPLLCSFSTPFLSPLWSNRLASAPFASSPWAQLESNPSLLKLQLFSVARGSAGCCFFFRNRGWVLACLLVLLRLLFVSPFGFLRHTGSINQHTPRSARSVGICVFFSTMISASAATTFDACHTSNPP